MNINLSGTKRLFASPDCFSKTKPAFILAVMLVLCSICGEAQTAKPVAKATAATVVKPTVAPVAKPTAAPAKATAPTTTVPTTTTATTTPPPAKIPVIDELVHTSPTRIATLHDPEYKKTDSYARRKAKYDKNQDDTARKTVSYPDGSKIHLKMVKNPSFGGQSSNIKTTTVKGSEKKEKKTDKGAAWECSSSSISLTASSTSFLDADYATAAGYIYPGAIYTFDNFFNGSYKETNGARYPVTLVNENPNVTGSAYVTIKNPGMPTITNGVNKLTDEMKGPAANEEFIYQVYETGNSAAQSLQVSGGGSYDGFSASDTYSTSGVSNSVSMTIDATKILYTINTVPQDSGFFADKNIENTRNLMVIGRVSYGIRVLANLTYTFNSQQEADQFKASYSGFGASANVNLNQISTSKSVSNTINCYVIGGPGNTTISFDKKDLEKQLKAIFKGATYRNAKPIQYSFFDMGGDLVGSYSATDNFTERNCVPNTNGAKLTSVFVAFKTGQDGKDNDTHYNIALYGGTAGSRNNFNGYDGYPQTTDNGDPFIAEYKTGPVNVVFSPNQTNTNQMAINGFLGNLERPGSVYNDLNLGWFVKNGGIVHLHIYPNGSDVWNIQSMALTLNFEGAPSQIINFGAFTVSDKSTEMTLYFNGDFKQK